jgi:hypothetical protein
VSIAEYNALMGFPRGYTFPDRYLADQRKYLSKGVCPPVAEWVLRTIVSHLEGKTLTKDVRLRPGEIADFNLRRKDVCRAA